LMSFIVVVSRDHHPTSHTGLPERLCITLLYGVTRTFCIAIFVRAASAKSTRIQTIVLYE
jgi:hypothetical protein